MACCDHRFATWDRTPQPAAGKASLSAFGKSLGAVAAAGGSVIRWGWHIGPAILGMAAVSVGTGGIVQSFAHAGGVFVGLVVGGAFAIAIDLKG